MAARTGCCIRGYTTRHYDTSGNIVWSANYLNGSATGAPRSQAVDSSRVYVGGSRITVSGTSWSLMALDIVDGSLLWIRDLYGDFSGNTSQVNHLRIDDSGNVVAYMSPYTDGTGCSVQPFAVVDTSGNLVTTRSFRVWAGSPFSRPAGSVQGLGGGVSFTINSIGDYHVLEHDASQTQVSIYEWLSPFSSVPTRRSMTTGWTPYVGQLGEQVIERLNGRDLVAAAGKSSTSTFSGGFTYTISGPALVIGKAQDACWTSYSDVDYEFTDFDGGWYAHPGGSGLAGGPNPAGTTQAGATALSAGDVIWVSWTPGAISGGWRLPSSPAAGDRVSILPNTSGSGAIGTSTACYMYPATGDSINYGTANNPVTANWGDFFIYDGVGTWRQINPASPYTFLRASGNSSNYAGVTSAGETYVLDSSGNWSWKHDRLALEPLIDGSGNVYTVGKLGSSNTATVRVRDSSGAWLWGHKHMGGASNTNINCIHMDPDGSGPIITGWDDTLASSATYCKRANDVDFVSDPDVFTPVTRTFTTVGTVADVPPTGWSNCEIECIGGGAGSIDDPFGDGNASCSGGGGEWSIKYFVTPASGNFSVTVGAGGARQTGNTGSTISGNGGGDSFVSYNSSTVCRAKGGSPPIAGNSSLGGTAGAGGTGGVGDLKYAGGNGLNVTTSTLGAAGGSSASAAGVGTNATGQSATTAPAGGGDGGAGSTTRNGNGSAGSAPGGAAGSPANGVSGSAQGAAGAAGQVILRYT